MFTTRMFTKRNGRGRSERRRDAWMFRGMLRDDGNRMASVRRDDKVKVKRRDKLGKVSDAPRPDGLVRNGTLKCEEGRSGEGEWEKVIEKWMWSLREIFREKIDAQRGFPGARARYCLAARTTPEKIMACDEAMEVNRGNETETARLGCR